MSFSSSSSLSSSTEAALASPQLSEELTQQTQKDAEQAVPTSIPHALFQWSESNPERLALVVGDGGQDKSHYTFAELTKEIDRYAHALTTLGIARGTKTLMMLPHSAHFFFVTYALMKIGAPVLLLSPDAKLQRIRECIRLGDIDAFIGSARAQMARISFGFRNSSPKIMITVGGPSLLGLNQLSQALEKAPTTPFPFSQTTGKNTTEDQNNRSTAVIVFSSGHRGPHRAVSYSHTELLAQVQTLQHCYKISDESPLVCTVPRFSLLWPALGITTVSPNIELTRGKKADTSSLAAGVVRFSGTVLMTNAAVLNNVGTYSIDHPKDLHSLTNIICIGGYCSAESLQRVERLLVDHTPIHTIYGTTEAFPIAATSTLDHIPEQCGGGVCLGQTYDDVTVKIIAITSTSRREQNSENSPLDDGEVGEIMVCHAAFPVGNYSHNNHEESKWLRTGDAGYLDKTGNVWFNGRVDDRVECPEKTFFTVPCERIFDTHPAVVRSALIGVKRADSFYAVICIELQQDLPIDNLELLRGELLERAQKHDATQGIKTVLFKNRLPIAVSQKTEIKRDELRSWVNDSLP